MLKKGTLGLIAGISGTGKSTLIGERETYRITTRKPRETELVDEKGKTYTFNKALEIISTEGIFISKYSGAFVSEEYFKQKLASKEIIGFKRFPDPEKGEMYGIRLPELKRALDEGRNVYEQMATFQPIEDIVQNLEGYNIKKILVLANPHEVHKRLVNRNTGKIESREQRNLDEIVNFSKNILYFDDIIIQTPEIITDHKKILSVCTKALDEIKNKSTLTIEYDFVTGIFRDTAKIYKKDPKTGPKLAKSLYKSIEKGFKDRFVPMLMRKTYPTIDDTSTLSLLINDVSTGNYSPALKISLMLSAILEDLGHQSESEDISDILFRSFETVKWRRPITNHMEAKLYKEFEQDAVANYATDKDTKIDIMKNFYGKNYEKIFKDSKINKDEEEEYINIGFGALMMRNRESRYNYTPGLMTLGTLRGINFHKLFNKSCIENPKTGNALFTTHSIISHRQYLNLDRMSCFYSEHTRLMNRLSLPNIYSGEEADNEKKFTYFSNEFLYSGAIAAQDYLLSGICWTKKIKLYNVVIQNIFDTMSDITERSLRLSENSQMPEIFKQALGFEAYNFADNALNILKADEDSDNGLNNVAMYPVVNNGIQFISNYWVRDFKSYDEYKRLFTDRAEEILIHIHENPKYKDSFDRKEKHFLRYVDKLVELKGGNYV